MHDPGALFAAVFVALWVAHQVGDHWVQTEHQAATKGQRNWAGISACAGHVATLTATKVVALNVLVWALGLDLVVWQVWLALAIDAASHYWADRRFTLRRLAVAAGHRPFYHLGAPREDRDDNPSLGTGAYALDQSWHIAWLFVAALVIAA